MHGHAAVGEVIDAVMAGIPMHQRCQVEVVRIRRATTFSEDVLRRWFEILAAGTALEGAGLEIEEVNRMVECACGRCSSIAIDDLVGYVWTCAVCGHTEEIDECDELEVIDVILARQEAPLAAGSR